MPEFTGERVIPGEVEPDLWNEHVSRYAFAARLASGKLVLDAGCGLGYGAAELSKVAASVTGIDVSSKVIEKAATLYRAPNLNFQSADVSTLPFQSHSFDLVVAFEVIEHLPEWREFLAEAKRVLKYAGQLIVSTPNKTYYAESRAQTGPNPFHVHEFAFEEFSRELEAFFPSVRMFLQNHAACVAFQPVHSPSWIAAEISMERSQPDPNASNFFLAVCSQAPQTGSPTYVYLPATANVLRERERHIRLLESELRQKDAWLDEAKTAHSLLLSAHESQAADLESRTAWVRDLEQQVKTGKTALDLLQADLDNIKSVLADERTQSERLLTSYQEKVAELEQEMMKRLKVYQANESRLESEVQARSVELERCVGLLHEAEATVEERTKWALNLQAELQEQQRRIRAVARSKWLRLGRRLGVGPELSNY